MKDEIKIDLKKYKKIYVKKTLLYLFLYPIIVVILLVILGKIIMIFGISVDPIIMVAGGILVFVFLNSIITWWAYYFGYKNTYKSTKFVLEGGNILFIRLKERNPISGGTFYYHNIQSVSSYTITNDKIIVNGYILKRKVDEGGSEDEYKERVINSISVPNVFGNVQLLDNALKNKKQEVISNGD
ncbi:hypothetical protein LL033_15925 [Clostridium estertheticum]|uniref:hypothetical protein n=1 Tax=Clostridium estertheticum TaxID=238834 RepID=UPI001C0CB213|nr:hypothetical protein [Clostridium estertheticum]MBU3215888.1 hypothetical protein [Clostridium estertheticum]WAG54124.1 hypothetical protein LL033_15925 [Clostridium estertheticum]